MIKIIILATLFVGTLDISSAFMDYAISTGKNPLFVLNYIASAVFGPQAFGDSIAMQLLGLLFHYIICFCICSAFFLITSKSPLLLRHPIATALLCAVTSWVITNPLLFPFTNLTNKTIDWTHWQKIVKAIAILFVAIGLPLTYMARWYFGRKKPSKPIDLPPPNPTAHPL